MKRTLFEDEHLIFRDAFRRFVAQEITPYHEHWEKEGIVPRDIWLQAGQLGFLCMDVPEVYGGGDTAELFFHDVHVPTENLLGDEGAGFYYLMSMLPQEPLSVAIIAKAYLDARVETIHAGTTEIMKEIIGRSLGF